MHTAVLESHEDPAFYIGLDKSERSTRPLTIVFVAVRREVEARLRLRLRRWRWRIEPIRDLS